MPRREIPLGRSFGVGRSPIAGMQSLVNMYAEQVQAESGVQIVCYGSPGTLAFSTIGGGNVRAQIRASEQNFAVVGTRLYSVASDGTAADLGEIEGSALCDITYDGGQITIVAENKSYSLDVPTLTLSEIVDPDFEQASSCCSLASYVIVAVKGTGRFRWKLVNDTDWPATNFATAEAESDQLTCIRKSGNSVMALGTESTEWWYPTGDSGADAFAKTSTAAASIGCVARDTAVLVDNALTWVGRDGKAGGVSVYRDAGYSPKKISSPEIDLLLEAVANATQLNAFTYQQAGHQFYVLNNPGEWTVAWDVSTNQWAWRKSGSWSMGSNPLGGWDAVSYSLNGTKQIIGSSDGNLYQLDLDTLTENDAEILHEVTTPIIQHGGRVARMSMLELDIETGLGQPSIYMSHSDDGGSTWSSPREASVGAVGEYRYRCLWTTMGSYRNRIIKFRGTGKVSFVGAHANIAVGPR